MCHKNLRILAGLSLFSCINITAATTITTPLATKSSTTSATSEATKTSTATATPTKSSTTTSTTATPEPKPKTANTESPDILSIPMAQIPFNNQVEVETLVRKAAEYVKSKGKEAAFSEFNKRDGLFTKGTLYVFAIDYKGKLLADGFNSEKIGKNVYDLQDATGKFINKDMIAKAKVGGGFELYQWINPKNNLMECKRSYVLPMEGGYFLASGYYFPPSAEGKCE